MLNKTLRRRNKKREPVSGAYFYGSSFYILSLSLCIVVALVSVVCLFVNVNIYMIQISQQHSKV